MDLIRNKQTIGMVVSVNTYLLYKYMWKGVVDQWKNKWIELVLKKIQV